MGAMSAIIRTSVVGVILTGGTFGVYRFISDRDLRRTIEQMEAVQKEMETRLAERQAMVDRLSRSERIAHIQVLGQNTAPGGEVLDTQAVFIELDDDGRELARQAFTVPGDVLFVDAWSVKFDSKDVAEGHPLRGRTLVLLRRVYSDQMPPRDGYVLDVPGAVPAGYATSEIGQFERRIWEHFWDLATNAEAAAALGVRVAQGEAVYKPVRTGQTYELVVDAGGGMSLVPVAERARTSPDA